MVELDVTRFTLLFMVLSDHLQRLRELGGQHGFATDFSTYERAEGEKPVKETYATYLMDYIVRECKDVNLTDVIVRAERASAELRTNQRYTPEMLIKEVRALREDIQQGLAAQKFAYILPGNAKYFGQEQPHGKQVYDAFPSARFDLREAGTCLACNLNLAAVFTSCGPPRLGCGSSGETEEYP